MFQVSIKSLCYAALIAMVMLSGIQQPALTKEKREHDSLMETPSPGINPNVILTTTESLEGLRIKEYRGIVRGIIVRQPTLGQGLKAELKGIVGGKMSPFITMCETARQQALDIMVQRAEAVGANAVVGVRYDSSAFGESDDMGTEVVCYGTAVILESKDGATKTANLPNFR